MAAMSPKRMPVQTVFSTVVIRPGRTAFNTKIQIPSSM